jgi:hypothetical protein
MGEGRFADASSPNIEIIATAVTFGTNGTNHDERHSNIEDSKLENPLPPLLSIQ